MPRKKVELKEIPDEIKKGKYTILGEINEQYVLLEDGRVWSRKKGDFLCTYIDKGYVYVPLMKRNGKISGYMPDMLVRKYFHSLDPIKSEEYQEIKDIPGYLVTKSGKIYSVKRYKFVNPVKMKNSGWMLVSLLKDGKRCTRYVARLVYETFIGEIP